MQRGVDVALYEQFKCYGLNAEGLTLTEGQGLPDEHMFRAATQQIKAVLR